MLSDALVTQMDAVLDRLGGADALWIFGSEAAGRATPESDVDVAVLFATRPSAEDSNAARAELEDVVGRPVDLVDLEIASPIVAMQVLRNGVLLRERSRAHRVRFTAALTGRYEDVMLLRRPLERLLRERLARGGS